MTNKDIREALVALAEPVTTQINLCMVPRVNVVEIIMTSRLRDFVRMNPSIFVGSKVGKESTRVLS